MLTNQSLIALQNIAMYSNTLIILQLNNNLDLYPTVTSPGSRTSTNTLRVTTLVGMVTIAMTFTLRTADDLGHWTASTV